MSPGSGDADAAPLRTWPIDLPRCALSPLSVDGRWQSVEMRQKCHQGPDLFSSDGSLPEASLRKAPFITNIPEYRTPCSAIQNS